MAGGEKYSDILTCVREKKEKKLVTAILLPFGSPFWALYKKQRQTFYLHECEYFTLKKILSKPFFGGLCSPYSS